MFDKLKAKVQKLKGEIAALYLVAQDPRTPWYAKIIVAGVVAYGLSPIGLIPHFIPVLGYLDDLVLLPVGIFLALKLIPPKLLADARQNAETTFVKLGDRPARYYLKRLAEEQQRKELEQVATTDARGP